MEAPPGIIRLKGVLELLRNNQRKSEALRQLCFLSKLVIKTLFLTQEIRIIHFSITQQEYK